MSQEPSVDESNSRKCLLEIWQEGVDIKASGAQASCALVGRLRV